MQHHPGESSFLEVPTAEQGKGIRSTPSQSGKIERLADLSKAEIPAAELSHHSYGYDLLIEYRVLGVCKPFAPEMADAGDLIAAENRLSRLDPCSSPFRGRCRS